MQCPNCKYETGYDWEKEKYNEEEEGDFYKISNTIEMKRNDSTRQLLGCPKCGIVFMSIR